MSLVLPTFASGAVINATTMMSMCSSAELYLNEEVAAADRASGWMIANHVYRPDFYGGSNPHTTLTSGEVYFRQRSLELPRAAYYSHYLSESTGAAGYIPVLGLGATIQIPENINTNGGHRVRVTASFYAYDYGGDDVYAGMDEDPTLIAALFGIQVNGALPTVTRPIHKGSRTGATEQYVAFYPRHQVCLFQSLALDEGVHDICVAINPVVPPDPGLWKHRLIVQGNLVIDYSCR